jgi:hypothetical protein
MLASTPQANPYMHKALKSINDASTTSAWNPTFNPNFGANVSDKIGKVGIGAGQYKDGGVHTDPPKKKGTSKKYNPMRTAMWDYLHQSGRDTTYVNTISDAIRHHESDNDYTKTQVTDTGKGPGQGGYQFEEGEDRGANTAGNRLSNVMANYAKIHPEDVNFWKKTQQSSMNASHLQPGTQDALFVADKMFEGDVEGFNALTKDRENSPSSREIFEFWAKSHKRKFGKKDWDELSGAEQEKEWAGWEDRTKGIFPENKKNIMTSTSGAPRRAFLLKFPCFASIRGSR